VDDGVLVEELGALVDVGMLAEESGAPE